MTLQIAFALAAVCLVQSPGSVSSVDLDDYLKQVDKARSACGPTCVWYCLARLGNPVELDEIWGQANWVQQGISVENMLELFDRHGLYALALSSNPKQIVDLPIPAILIVDSRHCVVFEGMTDDGRKVRCFEPSIGKTKIVPLEDCLVHWTGEALVFDIPPPSIAACFTVVATSAFMMCFITLAAANFIAR